MPWALVRETFRMPLEAPKVTVLMAFHNDADFLHDSIQSILEQSFEDFEFLIIDDCSTDGSSDIALSIKDSRIRLHRNLQNQGLTKSLIWGITQARGCYIARMDADDLAKPDRLTRQVNFLDNNPTIGIVGSACELIDTQGNSKGLYALPSTSIEIKWYSFLLNPFAHPTVMLRKSILINNKLNYNPDFQAAQDYELWVRLLEHTEGYNLQESLLSYRLGPGITQSKRKIQLENHDKIALQKVEKHFSDLQWSSVEVSEIRRHLTHDEISEFKVCERNSSFHAAKNYLALFKKFSQLQPKAVTLSLKNSVDKQAIRFLLMEKTPSKKLIFLFQLFSIHPHLILASLKMLKRIVKRKIASVLNYENSTSLFIRHQWWG